MISYRCITFVIVVMACQVTQSQEAIDAPYVQPPTPVLLDPDTPSFAPLDVEVDAFVRIPQARAQFGIDGTGLAVVVIDSGINPQHLSFQGRLIAGRNFSTEGHGENTVDTDGHGSNVAGIIMGRELAPNLGLPTGVAPAAHVIPLKVFPGGAFEKINEALQWVIDERERIRREHNLVVSVVNMSLGNRTNFNALPSLPAALQKQRELIGALRDKGVVVTVAAGNHYARFHPEQGMGFPAICPETTSVGALYDSDIAANPNGSALVTYRDGGQVFFTHPGRLTVFTQRLGGASGGPFRTDIFAPGFIVSSAGPVPPSGSGQDPTMTRTTQDGTSQATPVVSGLVLLLQHHFRNLMHQAGKTDSLPPVDLIEDCLRFGGVPITDFEDQTAQTMDNVQSSEADDLFRIDAILALDHLSKQINSDLQHLQIALLKSPDPKMQKDILARNTEVDYGRPDRSQAATPTLESGSVSRSNIPPLSERLAAVRAYTSGLETASQDSAEALEMNALNELSPARQALEERIIDNPDFLPADFIVIGAQRQAAVGRISFKAAYTHPSGNLFFSGDGWGTGFLVSPTILMTNNHVLENAVFSRDKVRVDFNFQRRLTDGMLEDADSYDFDPDDFFYTNASLDFTLVRVKPKTPGPTNPVGTGSVRSGDRWGFYSLANSESISDGDYFQNMRLNIVQHPDGRPKEVAVHQNRLDKLMSSRVRYTTDTEGGSSGSPVFDNRWVLMALHHRAGELDQHGNWKNNQGVRIDKIIADIKAKQDVPLEVKSELGL